MMPNLEKKEYQTVDGKNYRDIAAIMSKIGHQMNHSSVRNYIIRIMRQFVSAYAKKNEIELDKSTVNTIAQSPLFQQGIADILHDIYHEERNNDNVERNSEKPA